MREGVEREERIYRRGLVMGLTMAEIMVLILFALLLILGGRSQLFADDAVVTRGLAGLREAAGFQGGSANWIPEEFEVLTVYAEVGRSVTNSLNPERDRKAVDIAREATELLNLGMDTRNAFGNNKMNEAPSVAAAEFVQRTGTMLKEASSSGTYGSATIWIDSLMQCARTCNGNGLELPPCATMPNGKPAYVFRATMQSGALILHDNRWPHLEEARGNWPILSIAFDKELSDAEFRGQTRPIYEWSQERGCRFFVEIDDKTGIDEKLVFISKLRTVEEHFYKFLP
jgi:hypothetical protein